MSELKKLRLNLGLPHWLARVLFQPGWFLDIISVLSSLALPVEVVLFWLVDQLPAQVRHAIVMALWSLWLAVQRVLPHAWVQTGLSDELSLEAHAMGNAIFWVRLLPVTVRRMRFSLGNLDSCCPPSPGLCSDVIDLPTRGVRGVYLRLTASEDPPRVLFWIFGGAYVAGSVKGTVGFAEQYARKLGCDVFLVDHRLCPENTIEDAVVDVCRGYEWLLTKTTPDRIMFYGMSSGGGIALRVLQLARSAAEDRSKFFSTPSLPTPQPAGAVLCGAWVRYTEPTDSMRENGVMDWVVSPRVYELLFPKMGQMCGGENLRKHRSPLYHSMDGLCPLFLSVSEHEVCIDENRDLARRAAEAGVEVELDVHPFMPHAFQWCSPFLPEARAADARILKWVAGRGAPWAS